jgi:ABC-type polar amino acid transport system ATPase subunit
VHQDPALLDDRSIVDNMLLPAGATSDRARHDLYRESRTILARLGLEAVAHCRPPELSPSQARRAALARALLLRPGVLVVDEPTTGLDPVSAADVDAALTSVVDDDRAVIVITHHPRTHEHIGALPGARVVVVDAGRVRTFEQPLGEQSVHENGAPS